MGTSIGAKKRWANATEEQRRTMGRRTADDPVEFFRRVNKNGPVMPHMSTPCWLWTGVTRGGYGRFRIKGKFFNAHVRAFEMEHGPLSPDEKVLHHCDNPTCVRHDHLFKGSQHDNVRDAMDKGRRRYRGLPGEDNAAAKLSDRAVAALRANPPARHEKANRAKELSVTHRTLNKILQRTRRRIR